ncbi:MAG: UPF0147 family protein [Candidatus Kariarchaeaceae archaeon]|jgi:uncharacterized protein (UPF0147 family)
MSIEERFKEATEILNQISEDQSVPRNIRRAANKAIDLLNDKSMDLPVRAINAIEELEDTTADANTPFHTRTMVWQAITRLETPGDDEEEPDDEDEWEEWDEETQSWVIVRKSDQEDK